MTAPRPKVKAVKSRPVERQRIPQDRGPLEMVVRINMQDKGMQNIHVHQNDRPEDLADEFCHQHQITDEEKQTKLLNNLKAQISYHRNPVIQDTIYKPQQGCQPAPNANTRGELDVETKKKVQNIFNAIWPEYDEHNGQITM